MFLIYFAFGFFVAVIAVALMVELGLRKIWPWNETSRLTSIWSLSDIKGDKPLLIVAEQIAGVHVPEDSLIVTSDERVKGNVKLHEDLDKNFAIGTERALIFSSYIRPETFAIWTTNPKIIRRLTAEFNRLWQGS